MADVQAKVDVLTETLRQNQGELEAFARWCCRNQAKAHDIEDIIADAYFHAVQRLHQDLHLQVEDYKKWFFKFVYFTALKRRPNRERQISDEELSRIESEAYAFDAIRSRRERLREEIQRLGRDTAIILELFMDGYTAKEIAAERNTTPAAIRQVKSRAIRQLRDSLAD